MQTKTSFKFLGATLTCLIMVACGGGGGTSAVPNPNSSSSDASNNGSFSSVASSVDTTSPKALGYISNGAFQNGAIGTGNADTTLPAGGKILLTLNVVSGTGNLVTSPVEITFNSTCVASDEALFKVGSTTTNTVTANNGSATVQYIANGCVGEDLVTASAAINGSVKNATIKLNVQQDTVQTMKFVESLPINISLKGAGGNETSVVTFQVAGKTGAPVKDIDVTFSLSTTIGGMQLTNTTGKTDKNGNVSTTVQAGTIHTSVTVTATAKPSNIFTTSEPITVSTGIPDQKSMSIAASDLFPISWDINEITSSITVGLADAFNNPPPAGTAVSFTTEGGAITDKCITDITGACSATWISRDPKPTRNSPDNSVDRRLCVLFQGIDSDGNSIVSSLSDSEMIACRKERAGRITILATSTGNESFIDKNGNGFYDLLDQFYTAADAHPLDSTKAICRRNKPILSAETPENSADIPCDDLGEAYVDKNENGVHDDDEEFIDSTDANNSGAPDNNYSLANGIENNLKGIYNGALCTDKGVEDGICSKQQVIIRRDILLVMTSSKIMTRSNPTASGKNTLPFINKTLTGISPSTWFLLADENGHGAATGTTISIDNSNLTGGTASVDQKGPLPGSEDNIAVVISVKPAQNSVPAGSFNVVVTTPSSIGNKIYTETVNVNP